MDYKDCKDKGKPKILEGRFGLCTHAFTGMGNANVPDFPVELLDTAYL